VNIEINGKSYEQAASGDGQYDAFIKAIWSIYQSLNKPHPTLIDYLVTIPPGGKSDALVETSISWSYNDKQYRTRALDPDQTEAAIKATEKMLNLIENNK
jgi:D-citramalate synthase